MTLLSNLQTMSAVGFLTAWLAYPVFIPDCAMGVMVVKNCDCVHPVLHITVTWWRAVKLLSLQSTWVGGKTRQQISHFVIWDVLCGGTALFFNRNHTGSILAGHFLFSKWAMTSYTGVWELELQYCAESTSPACDGFVSESTMQH